MPRRRRAARARTAARRFSVAHPDTGYTLHDEIWSTVPGQNRIHPEQGLDFVSGDADPTDDLVGGLAHFPGHGTATASVIMSGQGGTRPGEFVSGVAPEAELVPLRVSTSVIHLSYGNLVAAIRHATQCQHHVISMSLGGPWPSDALERAVVDAVAAGIIVIAAAGNVYPFVVFPAALSNVVAVAASNCRDEPWRLSASGSAVDVTAPGESVWVARTEKGKPYRVERGSGTSFATAATAGAAAVWLSHHGRHNLVGRYGKENLSGIFKRLLVSHGVTTPNGWDTDNYGAGILDVRGLLQAPLPAAAPAVVPKAMVAPGGAAHRLTRIANAFPTVPRDELRRRLAALLGVSVADLDPVLENLGAELAVHLAVDATMRGAILADGTAPKSLAPKKKAPATSAHVRAAVSPRLRAQLAH